MYKSTAMFEYKIAENERGLNTQSKGERVKIPLLPNKVGRRSGTMTMVTTLDLFMLQKVSWNISKTSFKDFYS